MTGTLQSLLAAFDPELPLERAKTIPNTWYTSPDVARLERDAVFARSWQMVGRREQVATPGTFLTANIAGEPVLVVRGEDGTSAGVLQRLPAPGRAALHRGVRHGHEAPLPLPRLDLRPRRQPPRHARVRRRARTSARRTTASSPVAVAEWGPFVWVHLDEAARTRSRRSWVRCPRGSSRGRRSTD